MIVKLLFIVIGYSVVRRPLAIFNFLKIATESTATIFDLKHFLRWVYIVKLMTRGQGQACKKANI